VTFSDFRSS